MNRRPPFLKPGKPRDPLAGYTDEMRDALEAGARSMLAFSEQGDVRAQTHFSRVVCNGATMHVLLGLKVFEPIGEGFALRLTSLGHQLARDSAARRASVARMMERRKRDQAEARELAARLEARRMTSTKMEGETK